MNANPIDASASFSAPGRSRIKSRILWFLLGFACSWGCWSTISYIRMRPRDMTNALPKELRELAPEWMKEANGVALGRFALFTRANDSSADAIVYPVGTPSIGALFFDVDGDCQIDEMMVADAKQRTWTVHLNANHRDANSFEFSSGCVGDSVSYEDANMDGQYDTRFKLDEVEPDKRMSVWIDSQWHPSTVHGVKRYVEIDGAQVEVTQIDGTWQRVATN